MSERTEARQAWQQRRIDSWTSLLLLGVMVLTAGCIVRIVQLKIQPDQRLAAAAGSPFSTRVEPARRGDLLDRRGRIIATTTLGHRAFIAPAMVTDVATIGVDLQELADHAHVPQLAQAVRVAGDLQKIKLNLS